MSSDNDGWSFIVIFSVGVVVTLLVFPGIAHVAALTWLEVQDDVSRMSSYWSWQWCLCSFHISLLFFREMDWISYMAAPSQCSKKARHNAHLPLKPLFATCVLISRWPKTGLTPEWMWRQVEKLMVASSPQWLKATAGSILNVMFSLTFFLNCVFVSSCCRLKSRC